MSWNGKLIGGSLGSLLGPIGALTGGAIGHFFFDRQGTKQVEKKAIELLAAAASALLELARTQGTMTKQHDTFIRKQLCELNTLFGSYLCETEVVYLLDQAPRISDGLGRLGMLCANHNPVMQLFFTQLLRFVVCDGEPTHSELAGLHHFAHRAGLTENQFHNLSQHYFRHEPQPADAARLQAYQTLNVPYHADRAALLTAYRALCLKYHPDRHVNLDPDIRALTADKFAQIKAAYDLLTEHPSATDWLCLAPEADKLIPAQPGSQIRCLTCQYPATLPEAGQLATARCQYCQTLLVQERAFFEPHQR